MRSWVLTTATSKNGSFVQVGGAYAPEHGRPEVADRQLITLGFGPASATLPKPGASTVPPSSRPSRARRRRRPPPRPRRRSPRPPRPPPARPSRSTSTTTTTAPSTTTTKPSTTTKPVEANEGSCPGGGRGNQAPSPDPVGTQADAAHRGRADDRAGAGPPGVARGRRGHPVAGLPARRVQGGVSGRPCGRGPPDLCRRARTAGHGRRGALRRHATAASTTPSSSSTATS